MQTINWTAVETLGISMRDKDRQSTKDLYKTSSSLSSSKNVNRDTFYKYRQELLVTRMSAAELLERLAKLNIIYRSYANAYEELWDDERKAAEDERTGYGLLLQRLNESLRAFLTRESPVESKQWFEDMLFGFGRSPAALRTYLNKYILTGKSIEDVQNATLFERIREYMLVREHIVGQDNDRYSVFLRKLFVRMSDLLAAFQEGLSMYYLGYLKSHPKESQDRYRGFQPVDTFDMKDPEHFEFLKNYSFFEKQYTAQRKPFLLSNVEVGRGFNYTLDFLVENCGFNDVSDSVKQSQVLGDSQVTKWGGLTQFRVPPELLTEGRKAENQEGDLNFQQFVELSKQIGNLYLHDFTLLEECSHILWKSSPYDPTSDQLFRIPSVIGQYDLIQRLPISDYAQSWPTLRWPQRFKLKIAH